MKHRITAVWRPAYEKYAVGTWIVVAGLMFLLERGGGAMGIYLRCLWIMALVAAGIRLAQCFSLWESKARLTQQPDCARSSKQMLKMHKRARKLARKGKLRIET